MAVLNFSPPSQDTLFWILGAFKRGQDMGNDTGEHRSLFHTKRLATNKIIERREEKAGLKYTTHTLVFYLLFSSWTKKNPKQTSSCSGIK